MVNKNSFISSFKKIGLFTIIFLIIGELFIRVDIYLSLKNKDNIIEVNDVKLSKKDNNAKIMVLGDSFIYGGGISSSKKASKQLALTKNISVADLSRPSNNTLDNYNTFINYIDSVNPKMVVLGYHINDIIGGISEDKIKRDTASPKPITKPSTKDGMPVKKKESYAKYLVKAIYRSWKSFGYISSNLQNSLKVNYGIIIPGGEQYLISKELYKQSSPDWQVTQKLLGNMQKSCDERNIKMLVLVFTDFNTIKSDAINNFPINTFTNFCSTNDIEYIDTRKTFDNYPINDLVISRYDGHPNEFVHAILADLMYTYYTNNVPN